MLLTISHETTSFFIGHESIYLSMDLGTSQHVRWGIYDNDTFHEVLDVLSECMIKREELSMFIK
jgi:hypothetical protein